MGQFVDFAVQVGKDGIHHINLCRKLLKVVSKEQPSQRRFALWLQQNQIYDRALLQFLLKLCDIKVAQKATVGEVGEELVAEAAKSPSELGVPDPGGDFDENAEPGARRPGQAPAKKPAPKTVAAPADPPKDPFREALFQRFVELNGYLARFVFCEIQDGFLALKEVTLRVGSSAYHGDRPTGNQVQNWVKWMEFLNYLKPVGFRHKLSAVGVDAWNYLKEIPEESLIEKGALAVLDGIAETDKGAAPADTRLFISAEELAGPNAAPAGPLPEAKPPGAKDSRNGDEDAIAGEDEEVDFGPTGAPPREDDAADLDDEEDDDPAQAWKKGPEKKAGGKKKSADEDEEELTEADEDAIRELFGEVHAPPPKPKKPEPPKPEKTAEPKGPDAKKPAQPAAGPAPAAPAPAAPPARPAPAPAPAVERKPESEPALPAPDAAAITEKAAAAEARNERAAREAAEKRAAAPPPREPIGPVPLHPAPGRPAGGAPAAPASLREDQVELLAAQWEAAPGRRPLTARNAGVHGDFADGRRAFALFCLAATAMVLEAEAPFPSKLAALRELERARTLENFFELDWTLEKALDALGLVDTGREIGPAEERLLHLPRLKRAIGRKGALEAIDAARGERADLLRRMTGHAIGGGAYWVEREMKRLGLW